MFGKNKLENSLSASLKAPNHKKYVQQIHTACKKGNVSSVLELIALGVNVNDLSLGLAPIHRALVNRQTEILKILISAGADVNLRASVSCDSLMSRDQDRPTRFTENGATPLSLAALSIAKINQYATFNVSKLS